MGADVQNPQVSSWIQKLYSINTSYFVKCQKAALETEVLSQWGIFSLGNMHKQIARWLALFQTALVSFKLFL